MSRFCSLCIALLVASGCTRNEDAASDCRPGDARTCRCPGGEETLQECTAAGVFGACACAEDGLAMDGPEVEGAENEGDRDGGPAALRDGQAAPRNGNSSPAGPSANDASTPSASPDGGIGTLTEPSDEASYVFDPAQVRTYNIVIAPADLATINQDPGAEQWVPASLEFEGATYGPFQVRYKGSNGTLKYPCTNTNEGGPKSGKCSLKLGFDGVDPDARFFGLRKLNLHAMNTDASMLRDRLGYALFREHGVAASRAMHARVLINGVLEGLFIAVEQVDGRFTRARFSDGGEGNLYKEVWPLSSDPASYLKALETNEDEQPSVQPMLDFSAAIADPTRGLEGLLDRDYVLRYIAVDRVTINDDGMFHFYCDPARGGPGTNHNYYWYQAADRAQLWPIPWDLDVAFDGSPWVHLAVPWTASATCTCVPIPDYGGLWPSSCDPLMKRFLSWRTEYEREIDRFLAGPFAKPRVDAKLDTWSAQIRPYVIEASGVNRAPTEAAWSQALVELRTKVESARANRGYAY